jgi:hypothetical protein
LIQTKPVISERERGLLQRANSLNIHISQLQRNQRILSSENEQLVNTNQTKPTGPSWENQIFIFTFSLFSFVICLETSNGDGKRAAGRPAATGT